MLKKIFNTAVQAGEDAYYGMMLTGMSNSRRIRTNLYGGAGAGISLVGLMTANPVAALVGTAMVASSALSFWEAGVRIREHQPKP